MKKITSKKNKRIVPPKPIQNHGAKYAWVVQKLGSFAAHLELNTSWNNTIFCEPNFVPN